MIYDEDAGEILKDKFAQLYFKDIAKLFELNGTELKVLFLMTKAIGLGNAGSIKMHPKRKKEFAKQLGLKNYIQITNALYALIKAGVIRKVDPENKYDFEYIINPEILFSGNDYQRAKILVEYSGGSRKIKAFADEHSLAKYLERKIQD